MLDKEKSTISVKPLHKQKTKDQHRRLKRPARISPTVEQNLTASRCPASVASNNGVCPNFPWQFSLLPGPADVPFSQDQPSGLASTTHASSSYSFPPLSGLLAERWPLFPDDLDQHPLRPMAVELAVEDLLPRPEVELALGDRHDDFAAHDLPFQVGVGVVLAGAVVVVVVRVGVERGQLLQPDAEVVVQAALVVVDEDAGA